jgi:hypothetical protein
MIHEQAKAMSAWKHILDLSYRVAKRRNGLSLLKLRSIRLRCLSKALSYSRCALRLHYKLNQQLTRLTAFIFTVL